MNNDMIILYSKFKNIRKMGWIQTMRPGTGGIGYTFETLIGKNEENKPLPDFNGIEIKTMRYYTRGDITLFSLSPSGNSKHPAKEMAMIFGYPSKGNKQIRVFNIGLNAKDFTSVGYYNRLKLYINYNLKRIEVIGINCFYEKYNLNIYWSFDSIFKRLLDKLSYLAIIKAKSKYVDSTEYFFYKYINFYKLIDVNCFLKLLYSGDITVTFKLGLYNSGKNIGKMHDRGTNFSINIKNLEKLFYKL